MVCFVPRRSPKTGLRSRRRCGSMVGVEQHCWGIVKVNVTRLKDNDGTEGA